MAAPTVRAVGTVFSGQVLATPGVPAGTVAGDLLLMFIETDSTDTPTCTGWTQLLAATTAASASGTKLTVLWKISESTTPSRTTNDPGDHILARIVAITAGTFDPTDPLPAFNTGVLNIAGTTLNIPGITTPVADCLVFVGASAGLDPAADSTSAYSGFSNANLTGLTERINNQVLIANGGGFGVWSGVKATAGSTGSTSGTGPNSYRAQMCFAVRPAPTAVTVPISNIGTATLSGLVPLTKVFTFPPTGGASAVGMAATPRVVAKPTISAPVTLSGLPPLFFIPIRALPSQGVVTLSGLVPTARGAKIIQPSMGVLTCWWAVPLVKLGPKLPSIGVATLSGLAATTRVIAKPSIGTATLSGLVPKGRWILKPGQGVVTLSGLVPSGRWRLTTPTSVKVITLSGIAPTFKGVKSAQPSMAPVSLYGLVPKTVVRAKPSISSAVTLSGLPANFARKATPSIGTATLYGVVTPRAAWRVASPTTRQITLSGLPATFAKRTPALQGTLTLSGLAPTTLFRSTPSIGTVMLYGSVAEVTVPGAIIEQIIQVRSPLVWTR